MSSTYRTRDIHLRHVLGQEAHDFADGGDLQGGADDDDEVDERAVVLDEALVEGCWEVLAEEGDVGLHDAWGGDVVVVVGGGGGGAREGGERRAPSVFGGAVAVVATRAFTLILHLLLVCGWLSLRGQVLQVVDAARAVRDARGLEIVADGVPRHLMAAFDAGGGGEGAVALDQFVGPDAGGGLEVVDVLREVGQELAFFLEQRDEGVCGREAVAVREDVARDGVEDGWVLAEDLNVKDLLWVAEAEVC